MSPSMPGLCWMVLSVAFGTGLCAVPSDLDLSLMKQLITNLANNQAISPFVMSTLMTQAWLAARGATRNEMSPVLGITDDSFLADYQAAIAHLTSSVSAVDTRVFNGIYLRTGFDVKQNYTDVLDTYYSAEVKRYTTGSEAAEAINSAVATATNNIIPKLVTPDDMREAAFALVSALYFKGNWQTGFNETLTESESFLTSSGNKDVDMMRMKTEVPYKAMNDYDAISLPYKDPNYCMLLLRPHQRTMAAVQTLVDQLDTLDIEDILGQLVNQTINIGMPRFKIKAEYGLGDTFQALGIQRLFGFPSADLGNMADTLLKIDAAIHKVFIDVDETGTEAAGAGALIGVTSLPPSFVLDRPFIAIVWNRAHSINMFTAFVASPETETE